MYDRVVATKRMHRTVIVSSSILAWSRWALIAVTAVTVAAACLPYQNLYLRTVCSLHVLPV